MRLFIAGEGTLEALVLEGFSRRPGNVVGSFWLTFLSNVHLDSDARLLLGSCRCLPLSFEVLSEPFHSQHSATVDLVTMFTCVVPEKFQVCL